MAIIYCIITVLVVYYLAMWGWYQYADNKTENSAGNETLPENEDLAGYTLIGESRYKCGQIDPMPDKAGHLPQAVENDTIFAPEAAGTDETSGYGDDEPDYEDEEIAGYMAGDDAGRAAGVSFEELGEAVRTANADTSTEAEQRQAPTPPPKRNSGKPPGRWRGLRGQTSTMRWWRTSMAGWQGWRNC